MRILVAFDKFKNALTAARACEIAKAEILRVQPDAEVDCCPLTDGGEGFVEILTRSVGGTIRRKTVTGPRSQKVSAAVGLATFGSVPAGAREHLSTKLCNSDLVGIVEMASASGLELLVMELRNPWKTSTFGTGEMLSFARDLGCAAILLGVGGSATHDLGSGALAALGVQFVSQDGRIFENPAPNCWDEITVLRGRAEGEMPPLTIACDVRNPLVGLDGAAAVYAQQKGLRPGEIARLDLSSVRLAKQLCAHFGKPDNVMYAVGAGAAGGLSFGLMVGLDAQLSPGFELVADWLELKRRIASADVVITGEGHFDQSSLQGKGPGGVASHAVLLGKRVHVFAGACSTEALPGLHLHQISPRDASLATALVECRQNLEIAVRRQATLSFAGRSS